jgi:hypothetical protein
MTLSTRTFSFALLASCTLLALGTVLTNIVIDPQYLFRLGIVQAHPNPNERYRRFHEYERDARQVDGLLFSTSRGTAFDTHAMAQAMGLNNVASFAVPAGAMTDHLPFLKHVLRDKAAHGERIRKVLLLLDPDFFGTRPWTNSNLDSFLPPEVSGESSLRFWLRYLLALQYKSWREGLAAAGWIGKPRTSSNAVDATVAPLQLDRVRVVEAVQGKASRRDTAAVQIEDPAERIRRISRSRKPFLDAQMADLERFIRLCQQSGLELTVAINPLTRANASGYEAGRLEETIARINQLTDVWDFSAPAWLADDLSHWTDLSHFKSEIAVLMLQRMFSTNEVPAEFGRFRPRTAR